MSDLVLERRLEQDNGAATAFQAEIQRALHDYAHDPKIPEKFDLNLNPDIDPKARPRHDEGIIRGLYGPRSDSFYRLPDSPAANNGRPSQYIVENFSKYVNGRI